MLLIGPLECFWHLFCHKKFNWKLFHRYSNDIIKFSLWMKMESSITLRTSKTVVGSD